MPHVRAGLDSHQQRLRRGDLGHLGGRRETFEGRRENRVRLRVTASGVIEFGQRRA